MEIKNTYVVIAKIFPPASIEFKGVEYNEVKQEEAKGFILEANNFVGLDIENSTEKDFKTYLQNQTKKKYKNKKATISCFNIWKRKRKKF